MRGMLIAASALAAAQVKTSRPDLVTKQSKGDVFFRRPAGMSSRQWVRFRKTLKREGHGHTVVRNRIVEAAS